MVRRALISKHIVLPSTQSRRPVFGIILIEDEIIADVIIIDSTVPISDLLSKYSEWSPEDLQDFYISPGLIDMNVRLEFETCTELTKSAVSGGVTFALVEAGHYNDTPLNGTFYCDIGRVGILEISTIDSIPYLKQEGYFGIKGYLYPPDLSVQCIPSNLLSILQDIERTNLPFIIDPNLPDPRHHHMVSPFRLRPLIDRLHEHKESQSFSGAFPDLIEEDEEDSPEPKKNTRKSLVFSKGSPILKDRSNSDEASQQETRKTTELFLDIEEIKEEDDELIRLKQLRKGHGKTLLDDLDKRIKESQMTIRNLSLAEIETYKKAGITHFSSPAGLQPNPMHFPYSPISDTSSNASSIPGSPKPSLMQRRKIPGGLSIAVKQNDTKEHLYCFHMANYSQNWEVAGIVKLLEAVKKTSCKVHVCNVSAASSINKIRQAKEWAKKLTCEIPANHLYYSSMSIGETDTRFKLHPPIRTQANTNLLWDLIKLKGIDVISSGHACIDSRYKLTKDFQRAANGIPCVGFSLQTVWTTLNGPASSLTHLEHYIVRLAKWMSLNPAEVLGIAGTRGSIERGKFADLVIWKPFEKVTVTEDYGPFPECCPYIGSELYGKIYQVYIRGRKGYDQGKFKERGRVVYRMC